MLSFLFAVIISFVVGNARPTVASMRRSPDSPKCSIRVGENRKVTQSSDGSYFFEPVVAINQSDPKNVVVAGIERDTHDPSLKGQRDRLFYSSDGGKSWTKGAVVGGNATLAGFTDPGLQFSREGFRFIATGINAQHRLESLVYKSTDGATWDKLGISVPATDKIANAVVADSMSESDQLALFGMRFDAEELYSLHLEFIRDDGIIDATVTSSQELPLKPLLGRTALNTATSIPVSRRGRIYLPFQSWNFENFDGMHYWLSSFAAGDGAPSEPVELVKRNGSPLIRTGDVALNGYNFDYAIDAGNGIHQDRLYAVWVQPGQSSEAWDLLLAHSDNGGRWWREPVTVARINNPLQVIPRNFASPLPSIAVDPKGTVLVSWYQFGLSRASGRMQLWHQRLVTASVDGGESFLPASKLAKGRTLNFRYGENGALEHYLKTISDRKGGFHTVWLDGRSGQQEIWYSRVRISCN